jgi:hypothetical protein
LNSLAILRAVLRVGGDNQRSRLVHRMATNWLEYTSRANQGITGIVQIDGASDPGHQSAGGVPGHLKAPAEAIQAYATGFFGARPTRSARNKGYSKAA